MSQYTQDTERWLRSNAELYSRKGNQQMARNFELCAEDVKALRARLAEVEAKLGRWQEDMNAVLAQRDDYHANFAPLAEALREISNMKIPYCDADDVAHSMRDIAREALAKLEEK